MNKEILKKRKLKFGEYLLYKRVIQRHELITALSMQKIFGGKIGQNLLKLNVITENELYFYLEDFLQDYSTKIKTAGI